MSFERDKGLSQAERLAGGIPVIEFLPEMGKVRVLDVLLDVFPLSADPMANRFIPPWENIRDGTCWDEPTVRLLRDLAIGFQSTTFMRLEGPPGTSKSHIARAICALTNRNFIEYSNSHDTEIGDQLGRFIPSDHTIETSFLELLKNLDEKTQSKEYQIVKIAEQESRPLTILESKIIAKALGISGLEDDSTWMWHNGPHTGSMLYGSTKVDDEANQAPQGVMEGLNSSMDGKKSRIRIDGHKGEQIRPLTAKEEQIKAAGGFIPGVFGLHERYFYIATQNPWGIGGGRFEESPARRNRLRDRIVEALSAKDYEDYIRYLIAGNQPDITFNNKTYRGEKNIKTDYRSLEKMPNTEIFIQWLARFHTDLITLTEEGKIGTERDLKGGSYEYTRRNINRVFDTILDLPKSLLDVDRLHREGVITTTLNWHDIVMEGIIQEYLCGMYKEDRIAIEKAIEASGIFEHLGESINNPKPPAWVSKARNKGLIVDRTQGGWMLRRTQMQELQIDLSSLNDERTITEDYEINDNESDTIILTRKMKSICDTFPSPSQESYTPINTIGTTNDS